MKQETLKQFEQTIKRAKKGEVIILDEMKQDRIKELAIKNKYQKEYQKKDKHKIWLKAYRQTDKYKAYQKEY